MSLFLGKLMCSAGSFWAISTWDLWCFLWRVLFYCLCRGEPVSLRGLATSWTSATFPLFMFSLDSLISAVFVVLEYGSSKVLEVNMKLFQWMLACLFGSIDILIGLLLKHWGNVFWLKFWLPCFWSWLLQLGWIRYSICW